MMKILNLLIFMCLLQYIFADDKVNKFVSMQTDELLHYAKIGNAEAEFRLGLSYYSGMGVNKDVNYAIKWFKKSAQKGHKEAAYYLGLIYMQKQSESNTGLKAWYKTIELNPNNIKSENHAISIYDKVLDAHTNATQKKDPKAAFTLGLMFYSGNEIVANYEEALNWFELADKLGHKNAKKYVEIIKDKIKTKKSDSPQN